MTRYIKRIPDNCFLQDTETFDKEVELICQITKYANSFALKGYRWPYIQKKLTEKFGNKKYAWVINFLEFKKNIPKKYKKKNSKQYIKLTKNSRIPNLKIKDNDLKILLSLNTISEAHKYIVKNKLELKYNFDVKYILDWWTSKKFVKKEKPNE